MLWLTPVPLSLALVGASFLPPILPYAGLLGVVLLVLLGWQYWQKQRLRQAFKGLPSPPGHWLLNHIPPVLKAVKQKQFFQLLFDWSQQYGPAYVYWVGYPVLVLSQPEVIETTIINGMKDGSLVRSQSTSRAWNDISGPILLGQSGAEWQWRRKAWNPEFTATGLGPYGDRVNQACRRVIATIHAAQGQPIPVDAQFVELTMGVIGALLLGIPVDGTPSPEGPPLNIQKTYEAMAVVGYRFLRLATGEKSWMKYLPSRNSRDYWAARRYLEEVLGPRVDLALRLRDQPAETVAAGEISPSFQQSMLVKIAAKEPRYTRTTLMAEAVELLIAGTDTTAHTLSFAVGELACNPAVLHQAQAVVDRAWEQHGTFSLESLKDLTYLRAVVKETLRLYAVASGSTSLEAVRPTTVAGITVPRGTKIFWSMQGAGRDATIYPQPQQFQPERWLREMGGSPSLPMIDFGSGPHRCLGEQLALLEATLMLAQLLHHFDWELVHGRASLENLQQNLLIYPADGMPVRFRARAAVASAAAE